MRLYDKKDGWAIALFAVLCAILLALPSGRDSAVRSREVLFHRARVTEVDNRGIVVSGVIKTGTQNLQATLLAGPCDGQALSVANHLSGKMELDEFYRVGERLLVQYAEQDGAPVHGIARGHYRVGTILILVALFSVLLLLVAGTTGLKALFSFVFAALMIWKVMIPLFLRGVNPVPVALGVAAALTLSVCLLVGGWTRKGLVACFGALLGLLLTAVLAVFFTRWMGVSGAVRPYAETLLYSGFYDLRLTPIFTATIFVACSGAVMDLAMDIASAMDEIKHRHPDISRREHWVSGLRVGRAVVGTMTTTLLLAYSGSAMFMLMLFSAQGLPMVQLFNINYVSAEVLNTLVGSFGLVTVAPFTALVGALIYHRRR